jgi:hypothetical protein
MFLQKRRINITFRGKTSLWWESPVTPVIHTEIAMCVLQARRKLCLKLEHKVKGLMTDFTFLIFLLFVLLFTAYGCNSFDQPIRKLNNTYPRRLSVNNACARNVILKCDDCAINSDCESADVHVLASRLKALASSYLKSLANDGRWLRFLGRTILFDLCTFYPVRM